MSPTNGNQNLQREQIFEAVKKKFGFVPNVIRELAVSPAAAQAYLNAAGALGSGQLSQKEQQVVQVTVAVHNSCHYCAAAHGTAALGAGLDKSDLAAVLSGGTPSDRRIAAVVQTARLLLEKRGWLDDDDRKTVEGRGISLEQLYEIIGYIGVKTISNYVNHIAGTEIDEQFSAVTEMPEYQKVIAEAESVPA